MAGFKPVQSIGGAPYNGKIIHLGVNAVHATLLAKGDLVVSTGTANSKGLQECDAISTSSLITGVITGFLPNFSDLEQQGLPALTAGTALVAVGRDMLLEVASSTTVAVTDVGQNAACVVTAATLSGGLVHSNMTLNTASFGAATDQIRLEGLKDGGTAAGTICYVRINESTLDTVGI